MFEYDGILNCEGFAYEEGLDEILNATLSEPFSQGEGECFVDPIVSCFIANWLVDFFFSSELLYPDMKQMLQLIRNMRNFNMTSDSPNVCHGAVD